MTVGHLPKVLKSIEEKQCQERGENTRTERRGKDPKTSEIREKRSVKSGVKDENSKCIKIGKRRKKMQSIEKE